MKFPPLHRWDLTPKEAIALQEELRAKVVRKRDFKVVRTVAGCDMAIDTKRNEGIGAVIVFSFPEFAEIERQTLRAKLTYPYIPGLLTFREAPVLLKAFAEIDCVPDVVLFDGQGIAHPRGMGLATHMGLWLGLPTIGVAKSRLCGEHAEPGPEVGDGMPLVDKGEVVGAVLRTRRNVKPIYVSIGHRIDLPSAIEIVLGCLDRTRIPTPTREADRLVGAIKRAR